MCRRVEGWMALQYMALCLYGRKALCLYGSMSIRLWSRGCCGVRAVAVHGWGRAGGGAAPGPPRPGQGFGGRRRAPGSAPVHPGRAPAGSHGHGAAAGARPRFTRDTKRNKAK